MKGLLLDVDSGGVEGSIRLLVKTSEGTRFLEDPSFKPYFYLDAAKLPKHPLVKKTEEVTRSLNGEEKRFYKVYCEKPSDVPRASEELAAFGEVFEDKIPFHRRYLFDTGLKPCGGVEFTEKNGAIIENAKRCEAGFNVKSLALDIETHNKRGFSEAARDPAIIIGYAFGEKSGTLSYEKGGSEKEMLEEFSALVEKEDPDVLMTYNGDAFDLPYLKERARRVKAEYHLSRDGRPVTVKAFGLRPQARVSGRIHFDVFNATSFLNYIGAIKSPRLKLEIVYENVFGKKKKDVDKALIWELWEKGDKRVFDYCESDAKSCLELGERFLTLESELAKVSGLTLFDASRATAGQLVEALLTRESFKRKMILPNKPSYSQVQSRLANPIQGAFVKMPEPGVYDGVVVFDFRSLYPSIIVSHNVDLATLDDSAKNNESPVGHCFSLEKEGLIPSVLKEVLEKRYALKDAMKKARGTDKERLHARQWALKILANSFYGYMAYPRSRWYSREAGESVTAWARHYIKDTIRKAEEAGFNVLYGDSVTSERFLVLLDDKELVHVKNVEELFEENAKHLIECGEKQVIPLTGWRCLSVNPASKKTEWKKVTELIRHKTNKRVYRVNQKFGETRVTEDHSLMADTPNGLVEVKPVNAKKHRLAQAEVLKAKGGVEKIDVYEVLKDYSEKTVYKGFGKIKTIKCNSERVWFGWTNQKNPVKVKRFIGIETKEFESLCRLLGAYAAEGSSSTIETTRSRYGASIAGKRKWLEGLQKDYLALFTAKAGVIPSQKKTRHLTYRTQKGVKKTVVYKDDTHKLQMMNSLSAVFFKMFCGQKSAGKKLPDFIYNVPKKYQLIFLKKLLEGDGSRSVNERLGYSAEYKKKNFKYTTISAGLASGLSVLLRQLELNHSICYRPSKKAYTLSTSGKYNKRIQTKVAREEYSGWVYDLSVEDNHAFTDACGQIVLHNTDSVMMQCGDEEALAFQKKINDSLPEGMELELEDFYSRGIFVSKKQGGAGAKKKYALINREGKIKIRGFELVRRDWSRIARQTQRRILEILLKEGDVPKAVKEVKAVVSDLKNGKAALEDLVITTQLRKKVNDYAIKSPEVHAVKHAREHGVKVEENAVIGYVVTQEGKSISEKAVIAELAKDYDADYYVEKQVLPAVLKILGALGYDEKDIMMGGKQKGLGDW